MCSRDVKLLLNQSIKRTLEATVQNDRAELYRPSGLWFDHIEMPFAVREFHITTGVVYLVGMPSDICFMPVVCC